MGVQEGDRLAFVERGGEVVLRPVRESLRDLRGSVPVDGPQDFDAVRASVRTARALGHAITGPSDNSPSDAD